MAEHNNDDEVAKIFRLYANEGVRWFGVRTIFHWRIQRKYEERITIGRAASSQKALDLAKQEALDSPELNEYQGIEFVGAAHSFDTSGDFDGGVQGFEIFSLLRSSRLSPPRYVARYFSTGSRN